MATVIHGEFEWDSAKAAANIATHGVSFEEGATALSDPLSVDEPDSMHPERINTLGYSAAGRVLLVVSTERGDRTRIISAWRASKNEQARYHRGG